MTAENQDDPGPWILGISASHNGAACLLRGGTVVAAVQEERLSRMKRDRTFGGQPSLAVACCLEAGGVGAADLDLVVSCVQGRTALPPQDPALNPQLRAFGGPRLVVSHHMGHAVGAFVSSGFEDAAVLVVDGLGSPFEDLSPAQQAVADAVTDGWESTSMFSARGTTVTPVVQHLVPQGAWLIGRGPGMPRFRSLGGMYSAVAQQIFGDPMEAGKVMGLAPFGAPIFGPERFFGIEDGRLRFRDHVPDLFDHDRRWPLHRREYANLACSVQAALEVAILHLAGRIRVETGAGRLCYSGGVALNCVLNERLWREAGFAAVHVPPAADDAGCALGAAWFGRWHLGGSHPAAPATTDSVGPQASVRGIDEALSSVPGLMEIPSTDLLGDVAGRLADGEIGGWVQGRSELGPRALGQRSILADPRSESMKRALNARIKRREDFRPFAPAVLAEAVGDWFVVPGAVEPASPFMLRVWPVRPERRGEVPAVVHVDGTARIQTVHRGRLRELLLRFRGLTGVPMLLNTSFNGPGEPLVETAADALWCCVQHGLDFVVIGDRLFERDADVTVLELVPTIVGERGAGEGDAVSFEVTTPWGTRTQAVPSTLLAVLDAVDGVLDGNALLARLGDRLPRRNTEDWLRHALVQMRNSGLISLR